MLSHRYCTLWLLTLVNSTQYEACPRLFVEPTCVRAVLYMHLLCIVIRLELMAELAHASVIPQHIMAELYAEVNT